MPFSLIPRPHGRASYSGHMRGPYTQAMWEGLIPRPCERASYQSSGRASYQSGGRASYQSSGRASYPRHMGEPHILATWRALYAELCMRKEGWSAHTQAVWEWPGIYCLCMRKWLLDWLGIIRRKCFLAIREMLIITHETIYRQQANALPPTRSG